MLILLAACVQVGGWRSFPLNTLCSLFPSSDLRNGITWMFVRVQSTTSRHTLLYKADVKSLRKLLCSPTQPDKVPCAGLSRAWYRSTQLPQCIKVKESHNTSMKVQGERRYSSYSFTTSALAGGEWSASRPGRALPPGKGPPVPTVQEAGWAPEPVWTQRLEEKSFRLCRGSNLDRPVVQPVARHYTDWATRLHRNVCWSLKFRERLISW
jgi:hypothetical protein